MDWYTLFESFKCVGPISKTVEEFQGGCAFLAILAPFSKQKKKVRKTENVLPTLTSQQLLKIQRTDLKLKGSHRINVKTLPHL